MKATNIKTEAKGSTWFITAKINLLDYQKRFDHEPSQTEINEAVKSFEDNYAGLNESNNKSVKIIKHHSEG